MTRIQANLLLLLAGAMWGMGFVAQSTGMELVGPFLFVGIRFAISTLCVLPFAIREARRSDAALTTRDWRAFAWIGLMLLGAAVFQQHGLKTTSVTNSGFLTGLYVVITPFLGVIVFRQYPHRIVWPAAFCALIGIFLLSGGSAGRMTVGDFLTIIAAVFCAFQLIYTARDARMTGRPLTLSAMQFAVCAAGGLGLGLVFEPFPLDGIVAALPELLYLGIFSGGVAFTVQVIGQRYTTASQAAIFLSSEAVFAALFGALFLGERIAPIGLLGCGLILIAMLAVEIVPALAARRTARVSP